MRAHLHENQKVSTYNFKFDLKFFFRLHKIRQGNGDTFKKNQC